MKKDQVEMEGIDTDLSEAADAMVEARRNAAEANVHKDEAEANFIAIMREHGKNTINHENHKFTVKKGHTTKDSVLVK